MVLNAASTPSSAAGTVTDVPFLFVSVLDDRILNTIAVWNDFFTPLLYLGGSGNNTISIAIYSFTGQYVNQWGLIFAALIIGVIPLLIFYFILQRSIIKGFAGGLKG